MNLADLRYLLRYVIIFLITYSAVVLLRLAFKEFQWSLRHALRPARGYFLLTNPRRKLRKIERPKNKRSSFFGRKDGGERNPSQGNLSSIAARFAHRFRQDYGLQPVTVGGDIELLKDEDAVDLGQTYLAFWGRRDPGAKTSPSGQTGQTGPSGQTGRPNDAADSGDSTAFDFKGFERKYEDLSATMDNAPLYFRDEDSTTPNVGAEQLLGEDAAVMALPLYPTTLLGRSKRSDIRLKTEEVAKRHCTIYRYDGQWFILPNKYSNLVLINGAHITESTELQNRDQLQIGDLFFIFVDERSEAREQGIPYEGAALDDAYFLEAVKLTTRQPHDIFIVLNLFVGLGAGMIIFSLPDAFVPYRLWIAGVFAATIGLLDLYYMFLPKILGYADRLVILASGFLLSFGLILQARLALLGNPYFVSQMATGDPTVMEDVTQLMLRRFLMHGASSFAGLLLIWLIALLVSRTRMIEHLVAFCFVATPALLLASKILGREMFGATLRINVGPIAIQPTEFVKLTYLIVLANFFKNRPPLKQQFFFAGWAAVNFLLIMSLPDLGTAMILLPTTLIVFATMTSDYFKTFLIVCASIVLGAVSFILFPHVQSRLLGWTSLFQEVNDANLQIVYGLQAVARGGLTGRGVGNGNPWGIPLFNSDMVYSILFEEFGLIVGLCVLVFYIVFWLRSARVTMISRDGFASALALSLGTALFMEATVVIAGTMGLLPLTGATLPFIALGSNSLFAKWLMIGLFIGLSARHEQGANR